MKGIVIRLIVNAVALGVAAKIVPQIDYGDLTSLFVVALIFGIVNALIKPIVSLLTCPLVALTLGLFVLVINALMLWLTGWLAQMVGVDFTVGGFVPALLGAVIIWLVSTVLNVFVD